MMPLDHAVERGFAEMLAKQTQQLHSNNPHEPATNHSMFI
jgi:hypothetical protein